ncbi:MAG: hypothetical protein ACLPN2_11840 [Terriglobales bacterium]
MESAGKFGLRELQRIEKLRKQDLAGMVCDAKILAAYLFLLSGNLCNESLRTVCINTGYSCMVRKGAFDV